MKVLVADDSPVLRAAVTKLLEKAGYEVVVAEDGVDAITRFYETFPDLVLLDIQMPKLNGYVTCRLIKDDPRAANVPVLILTVRDSAEDRYWGAESGADGYLTKDGLGEGLLAAVRSALASRALAELNSIEADHLPVLGEFDVLTRVCEMLDRKLFEATVANEITQVGLRASGLETSLEEVFCAVRRLVAFDIAAVAFAEDLRTFVRSGPDVAYNEYEHFAGLVARKMGSDIGVEDLHLKALGAGPAESTPESGDVWRAFYATPLQVRGRSYGFLVLGAKTAGVFSDAVMRTLRTMVPAVASVIDSSAQFQEAMAKEAASNLSALSGF
jgi:DNA-binding response OmpR family regulator